MIFFFNDAAATEIYTLSLHDALPIFGGGGDDEDRRALAAQEVAAEVRRDLHAELHGAGHQQAVELVLGGRDGADRKSTRLNSSHANISYAVFCLKKKHLQLRCVY